MALKEAPAKTEKIYRTVIVEDDEAVRQFLVDVLRNNVRLAIAGTYGDEQNLLEFLAGSPSLDIVLSDCRIPGEDHIPVLTEYLARQEHRAGLIAMSGLDGEEVWQTRRPTDLPQHVGYDFIRKPFGLRELRSVIEKMIAHIEGTAEDMPEEEEHTPDEESPFTIPLCSFADLPSLMAALPVDAEKIVPQEGQLEHTVGLLSVSFEFLIKLVRGEAQPFQKEWDRCFPTNKRESLLHLLSDSPAAEFVLDCCWHDINGLLMIHKLTERNWQERERKKIQQHLAPAHCAFLNYCRTKNPSAFLMGQKVKIGTLEKEYTTVRIADFADRTIKGPAGALMSIFETFPSNAAKVGKGKPHMLEIEFQDRGAYMEAVVFDDLPHFNAGQLENLFDRRLESSGGWGTGLHRLAHLLELMWKEGQAGMLPIESYHFIDGQWYRKVPGSGPAQIDAGVVKAVCPKRPENTTKFFVLRFSHSGQK